MKLTLGYMTGLTVTIVTLLMANGRADLAWKGIAFMRYHAIKGALQPWGCPAFNKAACTSYDSKRYR